MNENRLVSIQMEPYTASVDLNKSAVVMIDMQRDFLEPGGFGDLLGNDVSKLQRAVEPCQKLLQAARDAGLLIVHTREGHRPDLSDLHAFKLLHPGAPESTKVIGKAGPIGRALIRGEVGHDIIESLYPKSGEPVIDKPGKGAFYATDLECILKVKGVQTLFVCGVTTEVCVNTTVREANDRGFHCVVVSDCCASYIDEFHDAALKMVSAQGGIFGSVTDCATIVSALGSK